MSGPNHFARQAVAMRNELRQSCGALLGIVQGFLADGELQDREILFLRDWLRNNSAISSCWPGNVLAGKIISALEDGRISDGARVHLIEVLRQLVGGHLDDLAQQTHVSELALDVVESVTIADRTFCLTGDFCFGKRSSCEDAIERKGGRVAGNVSKKLHYLVVGGLGSPEWKHGSFGTKIERAQELKAQGVTLLVVHEDAWATAMMRP